MNSVKRIVRDKSTIDVWKKTCRHYNRISRQIQDQIWKEIHRNILFQVSHHLWFQVNG